MAGDPTHSSGSGEDPPARPEDWPRVSQAFGDLAGLPETAWDAHLLATFPHEPALRAQVRRLLESDRAAGDFMAHPTMEHPAFSLAQHVAAEKAQPAAPGTQIGPYVLGELLGEGSFAHVYRAEQQRPLRRQVAVKVLKTGMDSKAVVARFEQERQTLARFSHPHIATVIDAGMDATGRPYFVMEYVAGTPLTTFCNRHRLPMRQRLELFMQACSAVQYSHSQGVIHRDLKPANIMASGQPHEARVKVIDFGISKMLGPAGLSNRGATLVTTERQLIGTPEYMSPEQVSSANAVDTRSDTYALGAVLYELLTGLLPFDSRRLREASMTQLESIICTEDPKPLAARLRQAPGGAERWCQDHFDLPAEQLERSLRGDLTWIALKALEKDPGRRYQTPAALSEDIARYLDGLPVEAAPPSTMYLVRKFVRRRKGMVAAVAAVAITLVAGAFTTAWWARQATIRADESAQHLLRSEAARLASASMLAGTARPQLRALLAVESVLTSCQAGGAPSSESMQALVDSLLSLGGLPLPGHSGPVVWAEFSSDERLLATASLDGTARVYDLTAAAPNAQPLVLRGHTAGLTHLAFQPSGSLLATGSKDGTVRLWDMRSSATGAAPIVLPIHAPDPAPGVSEHYVSQVAWSPDGRFLVVSCRDGLATIWDPSAPHDPIQRLAAHRAGITSVDWSADGTRILTYSLDHTAKVWAFDPATRTATEWASIATQGESWEYRGRFDRQGSVVLLEGNFELVHDISTPQAKLIMDFCHLVAAERVPRCVASRPGSRSIAIAQSGCGVVEIRQISDGTDGGPGVLVHTLQSNGSNSTDLAFSPDGRRLAAAYDNGAAYVWDLGLPVPQDHMQTLRGHDGPLLHVAFSPTGNLLATCSADGTARVWNLGHTDPSCGIPTRSAKGDQALPLHGGCYNVNFSASADAVLLVLSDGGCRLCPWSPDDAQRVRPCEVLTPRTLQRPFTTPHALSPDRSHSAMVDGTRHIRLVSLPPYSQPEALATEVAQAEFAAQPTIVCLAEHARRVAVRTVGETVTLLEPAPEGQLRTLAELRPGSGEIQSVSLTPDGRTLGVGAEDGTWSLYDVERSPPALLQPPINTLEYVECTAFSADGRRAACGGADSKVHLMERLPDGTFGKLQDLREHTGWVTKVQFLPDCNRLATGARDGTVRVWDLSSEGPARIVLTLSGIATHTYGIDATPDSRWLATCDGAGTVRIWPIAPLEMCLAAKRALGRDMTPAEWDLAHPGRPYERTWERLAALEAALKSH